MADQLTSRVSHICL